MPTSLPRDTAHQTLIVLLQQSICRLRVEEGRQVLLRLNAVLQTILTYLSRAKEVLMVACLLLAAEGHKIKTKRPTKKDLNRRLENAVQSLTESHRPQDLLPIR